MTLSIIVAIAKNFAIGKNNQLLYHLADDMKRFKEITTNHTVIMGKNTFMSLPKRPLANRRNIVLALANEIPDDKEGAEWVSSLNEAFDKCKNDEEVFVIGGASVYAQAYPFTDKIYLTIVDDEPQDADAFFPIINFNEWNSFDYKAFLPNKKNKKGFMFITLSRKEKMEQD